MVNACVLDSLCPPVLRGFCPDRGHEVADAMIAALGTGAVVKGIVGDTSRGTADSAGVPWT